MPIASVNPATGETLETFEALDAAAVELRLARAESAFRQYRVTGFEQRAELVNRAADLLDDGLEAVARTMTEEMGKPLTAARAEAAKCAKALRWYADRAAGLLADERPDAADVADSGASDAYVRYRPLGAVLAVMPWNFPFWQVIRFAAPALMAGNVCLLKHASNVPRTALALEDLFLRAGFPAGCFQTLLIGSGAVEGVIRDPRVAAVTLTGSEAAGRAVAAAFTDAMRALRVGDPMDERTDVGPLASEQGRADLEELVEDARAHGAGVDCGGRRPAGLDGGWYYEPTVVSGVTPRMRIHQEETFGPVATLYRAADLDEALALANDTPFGLSSNVWTTDGAEQQRFVRDIQAGGVFFNGMTASHPALPFGGVKRSGFGRELSGHGIREFCNITTVWLGPPQQS